MTRKPTKKPIPARKKCPKTGCVLWAPHGVPCKIERPAPKDEERQ